MWANISASALVKQLIHIIHFWLHFGWENCRSELHGMVEISVII